MVPYFIFQVTRSGEYVFDIDSSHKKPYEPLIIGRYSAKSKNRKKDAEVPGGYLKTDEEIKLSNGEDCKPLPEETAPTKFANLPYHKVLCSVPCVLHSRKPPLNGMFENLKSLLTQEMTPLYRVFQ